MRNILHALYRVRGPLYYAAAAILIGNALVTLIITDGGRELRLTIVVSAQVLAVLALTLTFTIPRSLTTPAKHIVYSPVTGRWQALNSPASAVPSHGVRAYGQAYAIDLVHEPIDSLRPRFGGPMTRSAHEYPAFGQPVHAMIDGTVVRVSDWRRDHRSRSNGWGLLYMMFEGMLREIGGPGFVVGNHVIIRGADGIYAAVAHLKRGSVAVKPGDRVTAGDIIGSCGNSGNSSEPHVHAQLMDRSSFWIAQGVPMAFSNITLEENLTVDALPSNGQHMTVHVLNGYPTARDRNQSR